MDTEFLILFVMTMTYNQRPIKNVYINVPMSHDQNSLTES